TRTCAASPPRPPPRGAPAPPIPRGRKRRRSPRSPRSRSRAAAARTSPAACPPRLPIRGSWTLALPYFHLGGRTAEDDFLRPFEAEGVRHFEAHRLRRPLLEVHLHLRLTAERLFVRLAVPVGVPAIRVAHAGAGLDDVVAVRALGHSRI